MPSLLGDRDTPQAPLRSRRAFVVSLIAHVALFVTIATVSLRTAIDLPTPHDPLAFVNAGPAITLANIPPPPRGGGLRQESSVTATVDEKKITAEPFTVPLTPPDGFDDTGDGSRNRGAAPGPGPGPFRGPADGDPGGIGDGIGDRVAPPPPPAPPAAKGPIRLHSGVTAPVKTSHVAPVYPPIAQSARIQGTIILEAIISETGRVESLRVLRSVPLLDDAAIAAVRQWQYRPALVSGTPTPVIMTITVDFRLAP